MVTAPSRFTSNFCIDEKKKKMMTNVRLVGYALRKRRRKKTECTDLEDFVRLLIDELVNHGRRCGRAGASCSGGR